MGLHGDKGCALFITQWVGPCVVCNHRLKPVESGFTCLGGINLGALPMFRYPAVKRFFSQAANDTCSDFQAQEVRETAIYIQRETGH